MYTAIHILYINFSIRILFELDRKNTIEQTGKTYGQCKIKNVHFIKTKKKDDSRKLLLTCLIKLLLIIALNKFEGNIPKISDRWKEGRKLTKSGVIFEKWCKSVSEKEIRNFELEFFFVEITGLYDSLHLLKCAQNLIVHFFSTNGKM